MIFTLSRLSGGLQGAWLLLAVLIAVAASPQMVRADGEPPVVVSDATDVGSPIAIYQSGYYPMGRGSHVLWFAYANRSHDLIARFEVRGSWIDDAGSEHGSFSTVVSMVLGPGERTTATIDSVAPGPPGARLRIAVDRVRFDNLALWTPPGTSSVTPSVTLSAGTSFDVEIGAIADSETAHDGDIVPFVVEHDVVVDGVTMIRRDTVGKGHLESVGRAANWGRSGSLQFVADSITAVDGNTVRLDGTLRIAPERQRLRGIRLLSGAFVKGTMAVLALGSPVSVKCSQDTAVAAIPPQAAVAR